MEIMSVDKSFKAWEVTRGEFRVEGRFAFVIFLNMAEIFV